MGEGSTPSRYTMNTTHNLRRALLLLALSVSTVVMATVVNPFTASAATYPNTGYDTSCTQALEGSGLSRGYNAGNGPRVVFTCFATTSAGSIFPTTNAEVIANWNGVNQVIDGVGHGTSYGVAYTSGVVARVVTGWQATKTQLSNGSWFIRGQYFVVDRANADGGIGPHSHRNFTTGAQVFSTDSTPSYATFCGSVPAPSDWLTNTTCSPLPPNDYGVTYSPPPAQPCDNMTATLPTLNGVSVNPLGVVVKPTDVVRVGFAPTVATGPQTTVKVALRLVPNGAFPALKSWAWPPVVGNTSIAMFLQIPPLGVQYLMTSVEVVCENPDGTRSFFRLGTGWDSDVAANRACASLGWKWPDEEIIPVDITTSGPRAFFTSASNATGSITGLYFDSDREDTGQRLLDFDPADSATFDFRVRYVYSSSGVQVHDYDGGLAFGPAVSTTYQVGFSPPIALPKEIMGVWCTDGAGPPILYRMSASYVALDVDGSGSDDDTAFAGGGGCYSASGMTLTNPVSWVTGGWKMGVCLVRWLIVPESAALSDRLSSFKDLQSEPPLQWVTASSTWLTSTSFTFATWADAGPACFDIMETTVCPRTWDQSSLAPTWLVSLLGFGLWLVVVVGVWKFF